MLKKIQDVLYKFFTGVDTSVIVTLGMSLGILTAVWAVKIVSWILSPVVYQINKGLRWSAELVAYFAAPAFFSTIETLRGSPSPMTSAATMIVGATFLLLIPTFMNWALPNKK